MRERTILNFNPENFTLQKVVNTVTAMQSAGIKVTSLVIDGVDIKKVSEDDMKAVAEFAADEKMTIWLTSTEESPKLEDSAPKAILPYFSAVLHLAPNPDCVDLVVLKLRADSPATTLKLDSKTLLITDK